ncbi:MAG: FecR family protein [Cyclobacteriaceae bacterium]
MSYQNYQVSDFVADDFFRRWVLSPDKETKAYWKAWCKQRPDKVPIIQQACTLVLMTNIEPVNYTEQDRLETWKNINQSLDKNKTSPALLPKPESRSAFRWIKLAAALTGFLLISIYAINTHFDRVEEYRTGYSEVITIPLPDGSTVMLNANSTLQVSSRWQQQREVWLEGEAFFTVEKSLKPSNQQEVTYRKFTVHAGEVAVEVLGTRFNVQNRPQTTQVILEEGAVALKHDAQNNQNSIQLYEGEIATYFPNNDSFKRELVDTESLLSWKESMHVFKATSLSEVAQTIENIYGHRVRVSAEVKKRRFSAKVPYGQIDLLLELLSESLDLHIEQSENLILIHPR